MATVQDLYELSPMQQGMLFHTLYAPESSAYFEQRSCLLEGRLDVEAFKQSWQAVVERHAVLRTAFYWEEADKPLQVVYERAQLPWIEANWQSLSEAEQAQRLNAFLQDDRAQGFQLNQAPLMRCALFHVSPEQHRFVWSHHHLLMDGWCNALLIKEVLAFYAACRQGQSLSPQPPQPYRDYILWLQQQDSQAAANYWQSHLAGFRVPTPLGIERSRQAVSTPQSEHDDQRRTLSLSLTTQLNTFAKQHHLTLNTLIQGAWALLLSYYSDTSDIVFGATVSGRPPTLPGAESIVGLFINTMPVRIAVSPETRLLPWLHQLQDAQRDREAYSYAALSDIQSWSELPSGIALFESLLVFENYPVSLDTALTDASSGLTIREGQGFEQTNYPLALVVIPGDTIALRVNYDRDRFAPTAIERLLGHLESLLQGMIAEPNQPLRSVPLLSENERHQLMDVWNQTEQPIPNRCVQEMIADQAKERPDAIAVVFQETTLTYRELDNRVNQLAHYLREQGVKPGERVAVCLERSAELVIVLLAVLKIGGTYVPLDPMYPAERLRFILADAAVSLLITADAAAVGVDELAGLVVEDAVGGTAHPTGVRVLDLGDVGGHSMDPIIAGEETRSIVSLQDDGVGQSDGDHTQPIYSPTPLLPHSPTTLAYLIYTSGSTGTPKGVPIRHQSLTNLLTSMAQAPGMTGQDTLLAVTTPAFDIAALELFLPLTVGGILVIASQDAVRDPQQLAAQLVQHDVTLMQATPATWRLLLKSGWQGKANLKLLCGGEALEGALAQQLLGCGSELWNLYGPTETTIWSAALKIEASTLEDGIVPIGQPIANTEFYILDSQQRPVPVGVPGELHIGGLGLSPGYWRREDLTGDRFLSNSKFKIQNSKFKTLYKTGDRVRYLENGTLQYLGRLDYQVKLRGFRIELGEIETVLTQHSNITQAVVVLREDKLVEPQLVAYVVRQKAEGRRQKVETIQNSSEFRRASLFSQSIPNSEFRTHLSQHLPAYMVPSQFVVLDALPLTPNGKVDRNALPVLARTEISDDSVTPLTPTEELLANIWSTVLGQQAIARDHNFFELGGHSLLATRVVAQVRQAFGVELPLRSLFEQPTLAQLAAVVDSLKLGESVAEPEAIASVERSGPLLLSDAQQRQWVLAQLEPESPFYIIPMAVRVQGELSLDLLQQSLERVVERHEVLRTAFQDVEGKAQLEIYPQVDVSIPLMDFSGLDEASQRQCVQEQIHQEARTPFDLSCAPLLRMRVLRLATADHIILLSLHHIITDGWSMGILVRELAQVYDALQAKRSVELPPLPIQYVDYAAWQQRQAKRQPLTYWQEQLQGVSPLLELPTDYPRPAVQSFAGATYEFRLAAEQTRALQELSQQQGVTLFMTLLATFQVLLYRYSGVEDLVIGTPTANRPRPELEGLMGMFVNTLVLRTDLSGNPRFEELLGRVRAMALDAYAHQSVPFEQVVDVLEVPRSWSHSPLFQVMFVLQNAPMDAIALDNLSWRPLSMNSNTAKFDLTLAMRLDEHELKGTLEYRTDLFTADTIHRMAGHLLQLLTVVAQRPTSRIAELPMLTEAEQAQLWQWNQTQTDYPRDRCIHQIFDQQVAATPDAIALIYGDQLFTYQALNAQANQLARHLQTNYAVRPDTLIGLWAERSPETVVAMLAILKAGGAYVPLDPTYPQARLQFMIADAQLSLVITPKTIELPAEASACQQLVLTTEATAIAQQHSGNLPNLTSPDNLAYVLYTSGSTGLPKGVCTPHRGVVRLVQDTDYVHFGPNEVFLQAASLSFDASTFEIWGALLNGGKLVLLPTLSPSLADLVGAIAQHQVTTLWLTAGLFHLMVDEQLEALKPIHQLLAGGDVLSTPHIRKALAALPYTRLINGYGPTENTTFTCCHPMTADSLEDSLTDISPPIGHPIANTQIYVLDTHLQPVPIGIPGELYIGGDGLARGYLNRPELTAERFVPNPWVEVGSRKSGVRSQESGVRSQRSGVRSQESEGEAQNSKLKTLPPPTPYPLPSTFYKTGDRVRLTPNGAIEFLGRLDNQVKIRGFRIELGEIETALLSHPAVEQAIVVPSTEEYGEPRRLVAYVLPKLVERSQEGTGNREQGKGRNEERRAIPFPQGRTKNEFKTQNSKLRTQNSLTPFRIPNSEFDNTTPQVLRQYLAEKLPDYMLPAAFVFLDVLPLTSNGKVDRQALPAPVWESVTTETLPQTAVEQALADIWVAVLRLESVGVRDNFFELGGDSILALQMVSRAAQAGVSLSPRQIFQHQTIAELAAVAGTTAASVEADLMVGAVPLTPIQHWFFEQKLVHPNHFNQAVCLELPLAVNRDRLDRAIQKVMAYHDTLRLRFSKTDEGWQQWFAEPESSVVESVNWIDLTALSEAEQIEAIAAHADQLQASLNLADGPLVSVSGFELGTERPSQLLIVIHHLVVDGLSWRILLEDLLLAYRRDEGFLPKTASFKQWSLWLQSVMAQCEDKDTLRYWQTMLQNSVIPVDYNAGENTAAAAQTVTIELSSQYTQALLQDVPSTYNTQIDDVLLTALVKGFAKWTGERSLLLTLENYGRRPEILGGELNLARTVGWFTCLYPVYLQLVGSELGEQLKAIKGQLRRVPHQGVSYGLLRYGTEVGGLAMEPSVSFNYLGQFDALLAEAEGFRLLPTPGAKNSPENRRSHLLDINGWVRDGQLQMEWTYSRNHHARTTVNSLAQAYLATLQQLIDHCQGTENQGYTPDDFNLVQLDQATLDAVLGKVTFQGGAGQ